MNHPTFVGQENIKFKLAYFECFLFFYGIHRFYRSSQNIQEVVRQIKWLDSPKTYKRDFSTDFSVSVLLEAL